MEIKLQVGIDKLVFGMRRKDVEAIYGTPSRRSTDEEQNDIWLFDEQRMRLTFYEDEDFRLGYIICSHPDLMLFGQKVIGKRTDEAKAMLDPKGITKWEEEDFDMAVNHFNEANWLILQSEFGYVAKVEIGAIINDKDEFVFRFK